MSWYLFIPPWVVVAASTFVAYRRGYRAGFRAGWGAAMGGLELVRSIGSMLRGMRAIGFRIGEPEEGE